MKRFIVTVIITLVIGSAFAFENPKSVQAEITQPVPIENVNTEKDAENEKVLENFKSNIKNIFQRVFSLFDKAEEEIKNKEWFIISLLKKYHRGFVPYGIFFYLLTKL